MSLIEKKALTKIQAIIIALIIIVAVIAGAAYYLFMTGPEEAPLEEEMELNVAWVSEVTTVDPHTGWSTDSLMVVRGCYERLVRLKGSTMQLEGVLAEDWEVSADGLEYTFDLREGVKFADGTPFNATAVKVSFERLIGIGQQSHNFVAIKDVEAIGPYTVKFTLEYPFAPFLNALATMQASITNPKALETHKTADDPWAMDWFHDWTNGTGPYRMKEWRKGEGWTLVRNPYYWRGWEGKHITKINMEIVVEPATNRMMMEKGDVDISFWMPKEDIPELQLNPNLKIVEYPALSTLYLAFNNEKPPLDDVHVRKAISYAFDYTQALAVILYHGKQSRGCMPSALWGWSNETFQYTKNMTAAREELAQSAYPDGGFTLSYLYCGGVEEERKLGMLLQSCLSELNIDVAIEVQPWATLTATTTNPETARHIVALFDFVFAPDPHFTVNDRFHSSRIPPGGYNWDYYNNTEVDQLLEQATLEQDKETRASMYHQVDQILVEEAAALFVYEESKIVTMGAWTHGFTPNPALVETFNFYDMYVVEEEKP